MYRLAENNVRKAEKFQDLQQNSWSSKNALQEANG